MSKKAEEKIIEKIQKSEAKNDKIVLVVCDKFLKMSYFIIITEKIIMKSLTKLFRNNI